MRTGVRYRWFTAVALGDLESSWASVYAGGIALAPGVTNRQRYLYSLQFAVMVLTSLGYGDITPQTDLERVFTLGAQLVGLVFFSCVCERVHTS